MAAAQAELSNPAKTKTAKVTGISNRTGKHYEISYKYADIADILAEARPVLARHGLSVAQPTELRNNSIILITRIIHKSGQWIEGEYPVASISGDHQKIGGALTYARRYALAAMIGIAAEEDMDVQGAAAAHAGQMAQSPKSKTMSKAQARKSYEILQKSLRACRTEPELYDWAERNQIGVEALPQDWADHLRREWVDLRDRLSATEKQETGTEASAPAADERNATTADEGASNAVEKNDMEGAQPLLENLRRDLGHCSMPEDVEAIRVAYAQHLHDAPPELARQIEAAFDEKLDEIGAKMEPAV
ncbi:MAG: ERF family protein [Mariprofundaceae bacterium]|nr:ERF family protein [Mariprofundaceae bacterium]